jgi:hypothetical protein
MRDGKRSAGVYFVAEMGPCLRRGDDIKNIYCYEVIPAQAGIHVSRYKPVLGSGKRKSDASAGF